MNYNPEIQSRIIKKNLEAFLKDHPEIEEIFDPTQIFGEAIEEESKPVPATEEEYIEWIYQYQEPPKLDTNLIEEWEIKSPLDYQDYLLQCVEIRKRRSPDSMEKLLLLQKAYKKSVEEQAKANFLKNLNRIQPLIEIIDEQGLIITQQLDEFKKILKQLQEKEISYGESYDLINEMSGKQKEMINKLADTFK